MNKKYFYIGGVVLLGVLLLFVIFGKGNKDGGDVESVADFSGKVSDVELQSILDDITKKSAEWEHTQPSSIDLIDEDFFGEKITAEEYALLSVRAIFDDVSALPEKYRGAKDTSMDNAFLFGLIHSNWSTFSKETQEKLMPFVVSPKNPKSYYYLNNTDAENKSILEGLSLIHTAKANDIMSFNSIEVTPNITVVYSSDSEKPAAEIVAQGVRDSLVRFKPFFGMENKKIDILLEKRLNGFLGLAGLSEDPEAESGQCDIKILIPQSDIGLKTTTAHEMFHCHQFWMDLVYRKPDTKWLMEATAVWSEDYVYHSHATEHRFDGHFFGRTDIDLLSISSDHEYSLYLWFYFLVQQSQNDSSHVYRALRLGTGDDVRGGMEILDDFTHIHRDFALWNWNRDPLKRYIDDPQFPKVTPYYTSVKQKTISSVGETSLPIELEKGAMTYNFVTFPNENIKRIEFTPKQFTGSNENSYSGLQAVYKINGEWYYEDWTGLETRSFCRDVPEENIEMVVLIANNALLRSIASGVVPIKTEKKCGPGWKGTITVKWQKQNEMTLGWAQGSYTEKAEYHISETLVYDPEYDNLLVAEQQYFAKFESDQKVESPSKECGQMWKYDQSRNGGSGFINYKKYGKDEMPERANGDGDEDMNTFGGGYMLSFGMLTTPDDHGERFSGYEKTATLNKACSLRMTPQADGISAETRQTSGNQFSYVPNGKKIQIDPKARSFSGEDSFDMGSNVIGTIKWNYVRVD